MALTQQEFLATSMQLINDPIVKSIGILVTMPGHAEPELIVTNSDDFAAKLYTYEHTHTEHMELRSNVLKRIISVVPFRLDISTIAQNTKKMQSV